MFFLKKAAPVLTSLALTVSLNCFKKSGVERTGWLTKLIGAKYFLLNDRSHLFVNLKLTCFCEKKM